MGCTKVKFRTQGDADTFISKLKSTARNKSHKKASSYLCPHCSTWHITSHPKGENGVIANQERQIKNLKAKLAEALKEIDRLQIINKKPNQVERALVCRQCAGKGFTRLGGCECCGGSGRIFIKTTN